MATPTSNRILVSQRGLVAPSSSGHSPAPCIIAAVLALGYVILLGPFLGLSAIGGSSEAREVHVASIIATTGEWVLPLRNGVVPSKPPFFHWVTALLGGVVGEVTPAVARATSLLFGAGVVFLVVILGIRLSRGVAGMTAEQSRFVGIGAGFVLASTYGFTQLALDARVDMAYSFFVVLAVFAILAPFSRETVEAQGRPMPLRERDFALFFGACGGAVLAKGPIGFVLPSLIVGSVLVYLVGWRAALGAMARPRVSWLLLGAIALPWYLAAAERGSDAFIQRQLLFENIRRFTGAEHMNNEPPWFYVGSLLRGAFPWSLVFLAHLGLIPWRRTAAKPYGEGRFSGGRLRACGAIWFLVGFVFLSLASGKRHSYLLPLYPGMSIFVAWCTVDLLGRFDDAARAVWFRRIMALNRLLGGLAALVIVGVTSFIAVGWAAEPTWEVTRRWLNAHAVPLSVASAVVIGLHLVGLVRRSVGPRFGLYSGAATLVWLLAALTTLGYGAKAELKGFDRMAAAVRERLAPGDDVVVLKTPYDEYFDPFMFYLGRPVRILPPEVGSIDCQGGSRYLGRADWFSNLAGGGAGQVREITTVYQTYDETIGRRDRGIVLFECVATPASTTPSGHPPESSE